MQVATERDVSRENMAARQEEEIKELLLKQAGDPAGKLMKMKRKLQFKHEKGCLCFICHCTTQKLDRIET